MASFSGWKRLKSKFGRLERKKVTKSQCAVSKLETQIYVKFLPSN